MSIVSIMLNFFVSVVFTAALKEDTISCSFLRLHFCGKNEGKYIFFFFECRYCRSVVFYWVWHSQRVEKKLLIFFISFMKNGLYIYIIQPQPHKEKWINLVVSFLPQWHRKINHCFSLLFEVGFVSVFIADKVVTYFSIRRVRQKIFF